MSSVETGTTTTHHISDVDTWGHPDRNFYVFVALSFFLGFFGFDHFYLRSYGTATQKFLMNVLGLGIWWMWDMIQVMQDGSQVRKDGLSSPFDWIRGIGRGVFTPLPKDLPTGAGATGATGGADGATESNAEYSAKKSYLIYTILAVGFGIFGADRFYIGRTWQGVAKLLSVFNIVLFLFGLIWVLWDAVHAFFFTKSIMKDGITLPVPFSFLFDSPIPAQDLFKVKKIEPEPVEKPFSIGSFVGGIPIIGPAKDAVVSVVSSIDPKEIMQSYISPIVSPTACGVVDRVSTGVEIGKRAASLATGALTAAPALISNITNQVQDATLNQIQTIANQKAATTMVPNAAQAATATPIPTPTPLQPMSGGAYTPSGMGPVLAGSLSALVLAGGLKGAYDFLSTR